MRETTVVDHGVGQPAGVRKLVAVSGSLRRASANTTLLRAASSLAPANVVLTLFDELGSLPLFNPDIEHDDLPSVARWERLLRECDGIVIASPEYAHGVPGAFKNALDWVVGSSALAGKPVALLNASPRAVHAQAALAEIITTMGWIMIEAASPLIPVANKNYTLADIVGNPALAEPLRAAITALACTCVE